VDTFSPLDFSHSRSTPSPVFDAVKKVRLEKAAVVKRGKATLVGFILHNSAYGERTVLFFDQASAPTSTDAVDFPLVLAPGETAIAEFSMQVPFFRGLAYAQSASRDHLEPADDISGVLLFA
jgi:hypothetical protein